ncbi:MAG: Gfo/Idh/MocA family oxidoreductase, partial [Dictyoglomaceae bacterium]
MDRFIGLIGLGYWGKNILRNLYELGVLHTACDFSHEVIEERKRSFPEVSYTTDFNDLLSNSEIKAIAIATPAVTHYELAKKALLAGKDVFVEKPMTTSVKEGEELVKIAEERNKIIMVGHILQYHPAVTKLKELISQGLIGEIIYIYSHRVNVGKIRTDENVWW